MFIVYDKIALTETILQSTKNRYINFWKIFYACVKLYIRVRRSWNFAEASINLWTILKYYVLQLLFLHMNFESKEPYFFSNANTNKKDWILYKKSIRVSFIALDWKIKPLWIGWDPSCNCSIWIYWIYINDRITWRRVIPEFYWELKILS